MEFKGDYIHGQFLKPKDVDGTILKSSPADLSDIVLEVGYTNTHVDMACESAAQAFREWSQLQMSERIVFMRKLQKVFEARKDDLATLISRETGKPKWETLTEAGAVVGKFNITIDHSLKLIEDQLVQNALPGVDGKVIFKPRGVMAVIGPFNFPAHLPNGHIVPSLLTGNTVVYKPSEVTPATGQFYAECVHEAGLPAGVFNLVQGEGDTGRRIVEHELVDGILFTGSYETGLRIKESTLNHYWKIHALEMGGKNATIIWEDADLEKAVYESLVGSFLSTGQRCSCTSRIMIHDKVYGEFVERFYQAAKKLKVGHWKTDAFMGPLINEKSLDTYLRFQEIALREGCSKVMRGKQLDMDHKGYYVSPSIYEVKEVSEKSVYQNSEIFGPNVALYNVSDLEQSVELNNSTGFGLVSSIFTKDQSVYEKVLSSANTGLVNWNRTTNGASSRMPFGGSGKSGNDRPTANFAVYYCTVPVATLMDQTPFDREKILPGIEY